MSRRRSRAGEASQAMAEFALVLPLLFFLVVGIFDLGRLFYIYVTIDNAAYEGARTAVRAAPPAGLGVPATLPSDAEILATVQARSVAVPVHFGDCPNSPIANDPGRGDAWLFITAPDGGALAPGGGQAGAPAGCPVVTRASGHVPIKVTVLYEFDPLTPLLHQWTHFTLRASATYLTEY